MFLIATLVSYGGALLIGLPSAHVLDRFGHLNNWTLLLVGIVGGGLIGLLEALVIPGNQKGIGPAVLFSISGAIVAGTFLLLAHLWRQHPEAKQPEGLISVLLDRSREFGDRHDAATDLAFYHEPEVIEALKCVRSDPAEDPDIVEEAEQSLIEIHRRNSES